MKRTPDTDFLREWLEETEGGPPDSAEGTSRAMSYLGGTKQASRWWPVPVFYEKSRSTARPPTATDTIEYQTTPIPATNGHTPTVSGRTTSMLSPVKAITAGAIVFAIGGAFLIAQPFQQPSSVPGAEAPPAEPMWVTGSVQPASPCSEGDVEIDGDVTRHRNVECSPQMWTSSDPRLTGEVVRRWNWDTYQTDEGRVSVWMDAAYLRNDGGGWACSNTSVAKDGVDVADPLTFTCIGDGDYAGLSASLVLTDAGGNAEDIVGLIFSGDLPPLPEPPAAD